MTEKSCATSESNTIPYNFIVILGLLILGSCISVMSTDMYTPSLPDLSDYFASSTDIVQLTISLNIIMLGVGQLILGPMSDRYGRRPVLLLSLCLFTMLTFAATFANTIEQLIIIRMFQGLMAAGHAVISLAIYKDLFNEKQHIKATAISGMVVALSPAIAPIIGGYIHIYLGWKYNFYFIGLAALLLFCLTWHLLPESSTPNKTALQYRKLKANYWALVKNRTFLVYASITGIGMSVIYIFVTAAPFIFIQTLNVPTQHYGYFQAIIVLSYFIGSIIAIRGVRYRTSWQILTIGIMFLLVGGAYLVFTLFLGYITKLSILFSFSLMAFGIGPLFAVAFPKAMRATRNTVAAGMTASMLGAIQMAIAGLMTILLSLFYDGSVRPLAYAMIILMVSMTALWLSARCIDKSNVGGSDYSNG